MQLVLRHPSHSLFHPGASLRPDPVRILGYASAMALNACALALLLAPLQAPPPMPAQDSQPTWILPVQVPEPMLARPLPPPPDPRPAPRQPSLPASPSLPGPQALTPDVTGQQALPEPIRVAIDAAPFPASTASALDPAPTSLQYALAPPPPYPRAALRAGLEGTVVLQVLVDVDGRPLEVELAQGSGHRALDLAARRHVLAHWRFRPAMRSGQPVQALGLVPITFSLD